jgi:hypothetical protein
VCDLLAVEYWLLALVCPMGSRLRLRVARQGELVEKPISDEYPGCHRNTYHSRKHILGEWYSVSQML